MATKYLEIDSTFRNRTLWPSPAKFEVIMAQGNSKTAVSAIDPVSTATPFESWFSNNFTANVAGSNTLAGTVTTAGIGSANSPTVVIFSVAPGAAQPAADYYAHATLTGPTGTTRILSYEYLGSNLAKVTVDPPIALVNGNPIVISDPSSLTTSRFFVPTGSFTANAYVNQFLYNDTVDSSALITDYDNVTGIVTVSGSLAGWSLTDSLTIRATNPAFVGTAGAGSTANLILSGISAPYSLVGSFIRIKPTLPNVAPGGEIRRILTYDSITSIATVSPSFSATTLGKKFEILSFSYDNFNPFVYKNTQQQDFSNYHVSLKSLVLPNGILTTAGGGHISHYPYVYVQLTPLNTSYTNIICSNNPNSTKMLFRASQSNFDSPFTTDFVHMIGDGMTQTVRFQLDTDFEFAVTMSDGQPFSTEALETYSPSAPNPLAQISAIFELKKL